MPPQSKIKNHEPKNLWRWTKLASAKWQDAWEERLYGVENSAIITVPGRRMLRLEAYGSKKQTDDLRKQFGGSVQRLKTEQWLKPAAKSTPPIRIRSRLVVHSGEPFAGADYARELFIPPELAFGTGSHATTAGCLRLLCDEADRWRHWRVADLGAGSAILALAAEKLGAESAFALEFDPLAVRTAKVNLRRNRSQRVELVCGDVFKWRSRDRFEVILANLFSELLIAAAERIARHLKPGGTLIYSGVLHSQHPEVLAALRKAGLTPLLAKRRGKWIYGKCTQPDLKPAIAKIR